VGLPRKKLLYMFSINFLEASLVVIAPCVPLLLPGIFFMRTHTWGVILLHVSRVILWSMGSLTILATLGLTLGISVQKTAVVLTTLGCIYALLHAKQFFKRQTAWYLLSVVLLILIPTSAFTVPFLKIHDGLPTGDVQKTIIWANEIIATHTLPNYTRAMTLLNRDPVDFYTPGLHAVSALVLSLSPAPLTSIGIFSIALAVCVALITASITKELFDTHEHFVPPLLAALLLLTQYRFLRYIREPGYHFQNIVGELFLFGMMLLVIRFLRKREKQDAFLFIVCAIALFLSHQFSAFIAVFIMIAMTFTAIALYKNKIVDAIRQHRNLALILFIVFFLATSTLLALGLGNKIPSIFTTNPHLTSQLLPFIEYPAMMGEFWLFSGSFGVVLMLMEARKGGLHHRQVFLFGSAVVALIALSQGPAIGIDIPPVRALFYLAVPLSVGSAYLFGKLFFVIGRTYHGKTKQIAHLAALSAIIIAGYSSTYKAYASLSHTIRTNSTLTGEQLGFIEQLERRGSRLGGRDDTPAILIDDYNRRSASWLVLSGAPMFTRIAADLERQMMESNQSSLRRYLYLNQIDYEKIIELGSLPEISFLLKKHNIAYVTGITNASRYGFEHNKIFKLVGFADDLTLYKVSGEQNACTSIECKFLIKPSTLANDIGDEMDTFEHLQASIRSPLTSEPLYDDTMTYREVRSPIIPLSFNVGDYVQVLWDPNNMHRSETTLTFMLWLKNPVQGLSLSTSSGEKIALPYRRHITVELPQNLVQINDKGFVTLTIHNPQGATVPIDLVALGSSLIP